jgi:hypothetical protein
MGTTIPEPLVSTTVPESFFQNCSNGKCPIFGWQAKKEDKCFYLKHSKGFIYDLY